MKQGCCGSGNPRRIPLYAYDPSRDTVRAPGERHGWLILLGFKQTERVFLSRVFGADVCWFEGVCRARRQRERTRGRTREMTLMSWGHAK